MPQALGSVMADDGQTFLGFLSTPQHQALAVCAWVQDGQCLVRMERVNCLLEGKKRTTGRGHSGDEEYELEVSEQNPAAVVTIP